MRASRLKTVLDQLVRGFVRSAVLLGCCGTLAPATVRAADIQPAAPNPPPVIRPGAFGNALLPPTGVAAAFENIDNGRGVFRVSWSRAMNAQYYFVGYSRRGANDWNYVAITSATSATIRVPSLQSNWPIYDYDVHVVSVRPDENGAAVLNPSRSIRIFWQAEG